MGDRGNIVIQYHQGSHSRIYLYTHWRGSEIKQILQRALQRKIRWGDLSYLTRIIFDELTKGEHGEETGYGISPYLTDNEHPLLVVDVARSQVWEEESRYSDTPKLLARCSFEEYIKLSFDEVNNGD